MSRSTIYRKMEEEGVSFGKYTELRLSENTPMMENAF